MFRLGLSWGACITLFVLLMLNKISFSLSNSTLLFLYVCTSVAFMQYRTLYKKFPKRTSNIRIWISLLYGLDIIFAMKFLKLPAHMYESQQAFLIFPSIMIIAIITRHIINQLLFKQILPKIARHQRCYGSPKNIKT